MDVTESICEMSFFVCGDFCDYLLGIPFRLELFINNVNVM